MALDTFGAALAFAQSSGYFVIFLLMILEGPIITTAAAFAASLGYVNIWIIFFLSLLGDLIGDFLHYLVGYIGRKALIEKYGQKFGLSKSALTRIEAHLHNHLGKTMVFIKFTPVLTTPGLMLAGALRVNFKKFLLLSLLITLPRTIFFTGLGFYFGLAADSLLKYFNLGQYLVVFAALLIVFVYFLYKKLSKKVVAKV